MDADKYGYLGWRFILWSTQCYLIDFIMIGSGFLGLVLIFYDVNRRCWRMYADGRG
jgi:hypothetical protein